MLNRGKVVDKCTGCQKVQDDICITFLFPDAKWRNNATCPVATHIERAPIDKRFMDPLKQSKKKAKGR